MSTTTTPPVTAWLRLKRWFSVDFREQASAEVRREEDVCARNAVTRIILDGGNR